MAPSKLQKKSRLRPPRPGFHNNSKIQRIQRFTERLRPMRFGTTPMAKLIFLWAVWEQVERLQELRRLLNRENPASKPSRWSRRIRRFYREENLGLTRSRELGQVLSRKFSTLE